MQRIGLASASLFVTLLVVSASLSYGEVQVRYGGTIVIGTPTEPGTLNIATTTDMNSHYIGPWILSSLVYQDLDGKHQPHLAESWTLSSDGLVFVFNLVKNARWHDGKPFTSADVKFTFEEVLKKYHPAGPTFTERIKSIETPDDYTVKFTFSKPFGPFLTVLTTLYSAILPKHLYENTDIRKNPYNMKLVGTGPFKFKEWVPGSHVVLEKSSDYWKGGKPYLDKVIFKFIPDPMARVLSLEKAEVDYLPHVVPFSEIPRLKANPNIEVVPSVQALGNQIFLGFNTRHPVLKEIEVRRAIAHAIDKNVLVDKAVYGFGKPATGPIHVNLLVYTPVPSYSYDPAEANRLLDKAGYPKGADGFRFTLQLITDRASFHVDKSSEIVREQLKEVGVRVDYRPLDKLAYQDAVAKWNFEMSMQFMWTGPDPLMGAGRIYLSKNIRQGVSNTANNWPYNNSRVDELFDLATTETDLTKRKALYYELASQIEKDLPVYNLVSFFDIGAFNKDYSGIPTTVWDAVASPYGDFVYWKKGTAPLATTATATAPPPVPPSPALPIESMVGVIVVLVIAAGVSFYARRRMRKKK